MKRQMFFFSLILISLCLAAPVTALGQNVQKGCESDGELGRYFLVLAGQRGTFYDKSGPAFPMLIKLDGERTQVDSIGVYSINGNRKFGTVPEETYREFMKEPRPPKDSRAASNVVMFRLELTSSQYGRCLKVLRTWERRVREDALLYPDISMNNMLFVKEVAESLNRCGEKEIKLYHLNWEADDKLSDGIRPSRVPFLFFRELRRLNESLHVRDEKFQEYIAAARQAKQ